MRSDPVGTTSPPWAHLANPQPTSVGVAEEDFVELGSTAANTKSLGQNEVDQIMEIYRESDAFGVSLVANRVDGMLRSVGGAMIELALRRGLAIDAMAKVVRVMRSATGGGRYGAKKNSNAFSCWRKLAACGDGFKCVST